MVRLFAVLCTLVLMASPVLAQSASPRLKPGIAFDNPIPNIPGKKILGVLVNYSAASSRIIGLHHRLCDFRRGAQPSG